MKTQRLPPLPREFYDRDVILVARELIGKRVWRTARNVVLSGRIVETEAYLAAGDEACHAHRGPTRKNASMFGPPGHAYVYAIHSRWCLNAVAGPPGVACAVLIRAVEPLVGIESMQRARGTDRVRDLTRGPGRLCEAFQIDKRLDGWDLTVGSRLWISAVPTDAPLRAIGQSPRIGVTSAHHLPLRFFVHDNPFVSGPRRLKRPN